MDSLKEHVISLDHKIADVRLRALESIRFKIENGLVRMQDLLQETEGLIVRKLLEYMNLPERRIEDALLLLEQAVLVRFLLDSEDCRANFDGDRIRSARGNTSRGNRLPALFGTGCGHIRSAACVQ